MKITLRTKPLRNGMLRLYLEYYHEGTRSFEFLKDYELYANPKTKEERTHNSETLEVAEGIRDKRKVEKKEGRFSLARLDRMKLYAFMFDYQIQNNMVTSAFNKAAEYFPEGLLLRDITPLMVEDYGKFLKTEMGTQTSSRNYFTIFKGMLRRAKKEGRLGFSPSDDVEVRFKIDKSKKKEYSPPKEVNKIWKTEIHVKHRANPEHPELIKRALVFAMNTGMGMAEIFNVKHMEKSLRWKHVKRDSISHHRAKTGKPFSIPLDAELKKLMGERREPEDLVFPGLPRSHNTVRKYIDRMCEEAKVTRLTFYCGRHTFITNLGRKFNSASISPLSGSTAEHIESYLHEIRQDSKQAIKSLPSVFGKKR